jgi:hypothetical protein
MGWWWRTRGTILGIDLQTSLQNRRIEIRIIQINIGQDGSQESFCSLETVL